MIELENLNIGELCVHYKVCRIKPCHAHCDEYLPKDHCVTERPHGEWIWEKDEDALRTYDLLCSECGYKTFTGENFDNVEQVKKVVNDRIREGKTLFSFCPKCGAKMGRWCNK